MTIYAAFNELDVTNPDGATTTDSYVAVAGVNRAGFYVPYGSSTAVAPLTEAITEGWFHIRIKAQAQTTFGNTGYVFFSLGNSAATCFTLAQYPSGSSTNYVRLTLTAGGGGTVDTSVASVSLARTFDIHFKIGSPGFIKGYLEGALMINYVGNVIMAAGSQNVDRLSFPAATASSASAACLMSHVIVSDESTIDARVHTLATTNTADTNWTGTVSNVTGTGYATLGNSIRALTTGKILQLSHSMPAIQSYERIAAVCFSASGISEDATEGYQVDMLTKYGGNYTALEDPATLNQSTWTEKQWIMHTHPETAAAWDVTSINATTVGLLSGFAP